MKKNRHNNHNYRYLDLSTMLLSLADLAHSCAEKKVLALRLLEILRPFLGNAEYRQIKAEINSDYQLCREVFEK